MTDAVPLELSLVPIEPVRGAVAPRGWQFGPGWFDSSWELRAGLEVREGSGAETLFAWIETWLQAGGGSGVSFSAT